ncbi:probable rRNA-processing protein EBP2 homolog [Fopius arisanus]|uniref:Probable rRNA-processing protein EBP2 homolog n=1 Tax=Fopius arisanus TaxID=64838 RepID=A0A9R1T7H1_9HYME|nr:PREDICTED: probable rRNA-processing protein EBP2 homolog [Fopius arisanus]
MKEKVKKSRKKIVPESDSDYDSSDEELQEAFAKGLLKPGLNSIVVTEKKKTNNNIAQLKRKTEEMKLKLPWIERLDIVNPPAPLAPELALQLQETEERRLKLAKGNKKLPQYKPGEDPVVNDFKRETMFHRQAQSAVMDGITRIKKLGVPTIRPDDYFAEMVKTDEHMHKVRENLARKQLATERSEKVRQLRQQRKVGKQMQIEATLKKHAEKKKMLDEVKKYRKGIRKDLDFLDDKKTANRSGSDKGNPRRRKGIERMKMKNSKFGFGGKKRGSKMNTRDSAADVSDWKRPSKFPTKGGKVKKMAKKAMRPGKNKRVSIKARRN